jgi:hypothetical protein
MTIFTPWSQIFIIVFVVATAINITTTYIFPCRIIIRMPPKLCSRFSASVSILSNILMSVSLLNPLGERGWRCNYSWICLLPDARPPEHVTGKNVCRPFEKSIIKFTKLFQQIAQQLCKEEGLNDNTDIEECRLLGSGTVCIL